MRHFVRLVAFVSAGVVLALTAAAPAVAAAEANIGQIEPGDDQTVRLVFAVTGLPSGTTADLGTVSVTVDGEPVEARAERIEDSGIHRQTILAIDTSISMRGPRFTAAKDAALAYIDAAPEDLLIGVVSFDGNVQVVTEPTLDREELSRQIHGLQLEAGTALYDGVIQAVVQAGSEGSRNVLLLSDGADTSDTSIEDAIAVASESDVRVDVVAIEQDERRQALLHRIAEAADGGVITVDDTETLEALYTEQAENLARQFLVTFEQPAGASGDTAVQVSVEAGGTTYTDSALVRLAAFESGDGAPDIGPKTVDTSGALVDDGGLLVGGAALTLGLAVVLAFALGAAPRGRRSLVQHQLDHYSVDRKAVQGLAGKAHAGHPAQTAVLRDAAVAAAHSVLQKADFETKLSQRLVAAAVTMTASEWMLLHVGIGVLAGVVGFVFGNALTMLVGVAVGIVAPWLYLGFRSRRRQSAFHAQLAETLQLIGGGLSAGLSLPQAIDTVVREGAAPMSDEMRRALIEQRLGVDIEDALDGVADRMDSLDFRWVVMAIRIQREVGGNLAELLNTVAATLREREYLRRQVKVLSAEGRLSAWIIGALPVGMFLYIQVTQPEYLSRMYTTAVGWMMLIAAVVLLGMGAFMLKKVVKVEV